MSDVGIALRRWWSGRRRTLPIIFSETAPLDLRIVGRMLLHAALVGVLAGLLGAAFFGSLEFLQRLLLETLAGYAPLRAWGERFAEGDAQPASFRPAVLLLLPALGGLACGWLSRLAPEVRGGGTDAMLEAFHAKSGLIRRRVIWLKALASLCTLGTGGAGGREGPVMQIGGGLGSALARMLHTSSRERRVLLLAGVAAGMAAVFRTPLGAALLSVEVLYRDGFESDGLVPAILASVVSYSVVISIYGESTLFSHSQRFPFVPAHLPLYGLLALLAAALALAFISVLRATRTLLAKLPLKAWLRPAVGGLLLGCMATPLVMLVGNRLGQPGQGLGLLGGGYGAVQIAISGAPWLPEGWPGISMLLLVTLLKVVAASLTVGSGGSGGDFAPSLAIGGMLGGAFGRAARLLWRDPRIDPGAFALVGMGALYGGAAHVPLSALVLVCELAGTYDLLVPLMLAEGIAMIALRRHSLYEAQVPTQRDSPIHRDAALLDLLKAYRVKELVSTRPFLTFTAESRTDEMLHHLGEATRQEVFPVVDRSGKMIGLVSAEALRVLAAERDYTEWALAADIMVQPVSVTPDDDLRRATKLLVASGLREVPVVDGENRVVGFLDEAEVAGAYLRAASRAEESTAT